jgi:hypothetical protein
MKTLHITLGITAVATLGFIFLRQTTEDRQPSIKENQSEEVVFID